MEQPWRPLLDLDAIDPPGVQRALAKQKRHPRQNPTDTIELETVLAHHLDVQAAMDRIVASQVGTADAFFRRKLWCEEGYVLLFFPLIRLPDGKLGLKPTELCHGLVDVLVLSTHTFSLAEVSTVEWELRAQFARQALVLESQGLTPCGHMAVRMRLGSPGLKLVTSPCTGTKMIHLAQKVVAWDDCKRLWNAAELFRRETSRCAGYAGAPPDLFHAYAFSDLVHELTIPESNPPMTALQQFLLDSTGMMTMAMRGTHAREAVLCGARYQILTENPKTFWPDGHEDLSAPTAFDAEASLADDLIAEIEGGVEAKLGDLREARGVTLENVGISEGPLTDLVPEAMEVEQTAAPPITSSTPVPRAQLRRSARLGSVGGA